MALNSMPVNVCVFSSLLILLSLMDAAIMFWIVSSSFRSANNAFINV